MTTVGRKASLAVSDSPNLDIVRAIAVMLVFVSHVPPWKSFALERGFYMGMVGSLGVSIFFVHTSLVLMASLERLGREASPRGTYASFAIRRAFRVYPLSMLAVLAVQALAPLGAWEPLGVPAVIANLPLVQNLTGSVSAPATLWSLPYEIQMYLVLPFLFDLVVRDKRRAARDTNR